MLTAKLGESNINCFDGKYDRYRLKQWSNKGILKCPVCDGKYEYCHGEVVSPYFRHTGKECSGYYSEPETDEHRNGKVILYNWIRKQDGVTNCKLEDWIPETKQRPDIYFEYNGKKFVIEYQCTPIASEFLIRRELYKLAGINDIWILGTDKYTNLTIYPTGNVTYMSTRYRTIEKECMKNGLIYFDSKFKIFILHSSFLSNVHSLLKYYKGGFLESEFYRKHNYIIGGNLEYFFTIERLENFEFNNGLKLKNEIVKMFSLLEDDLNAEWMENQNSERKFREKIDKLNKLKVNSKYIGSVGEKIKIDGYAVKSHRYKSWHGERYINEAIDEDGNVYVWFSYGGISSHRGSKITIEAIIQSHNIYLGSKQNLLTNCKVVKTEGGDCH